MGLGRVELPTSRVSGTCLCRAYSAKRTPWGGGSHVHVHPRSRDRGVHDMNLTHILTQREMTDPRSPSKSTATPAAPLFTCDVGSLRCDSADFVGAVPKSDPRAVPVEGPLAMRPRCPSPNRCKSRGTAGFAAFRSVGCGHGLRKGERCSAANGNCFGTHNEQPQRPAASGARARAELLASNDAAAGRST
jgi:hypothetical protein